MQFPGTHHTAADKSTDYETNFEVWKTEHPCSLIYQLCRHDAYRRDKISHGVSDLQYGRQMQISDNY